MSCSEIKEQIIAAMEPDYEYIDFVSFANKIIEKTEKEKTKELSVLLKCFYFKMVGIVLLSAF